jgi:uncharacterized protein YheU (UPF0270 family)
LKTIIVKDAASPDPKPEQAVEIDPKRLSDGALNALVESFILREGTDYGWHEVALATKKAQVMRLLCDGEVKIYFNIEQETCTLARVEA